MRPLIGILARGVFWLSAVWIVGSAAVSFWAAGNIVFAVGSVVLFPLTYFVFPLVSGMWPILVVSVIAYVVSTTVGGLAPVD